MPVIAMKVVKKEPHPGTDQLFLYTFESPAIGTRLIVANLTNVYEVGQVGAVAQPGTFLPGLEIVPRKVFGVHSEGMALGVVEAEVDTDLSDRFEADRPVRPFRVLVEVEVEARYAEDAGKAAAKAVAKGAGRVLSAEAVAGEGSGVDRPVG